MPSPDDPIYTKTKVSRGIGAGVGMAASIIREIVPQPVGAVFSVLSAISSGSQASVALAVADETLRLVAGCDKQARQRYMMGPN